MSILSRVVRGTASRSNAGEVFAGHSSASIGSASRRVNGGARRVGIVGVAVLAAMALGPDPDAKAGPAPGCPQGPAPGSVPACAQRAFLADITAAGLGNGYGGVEALDQGLDICGLMDSGVSRHIMVSQFAADNPTLGVDG